MSRLPRISAIVVALLVPACILIGPDPGGPDRIVSDTEWELRRAFLSGVIVDATPLDPPATIAFGRAEIAGGDTWTETGLVEGFTGCNDLAGTYRFEREDSEGGAVQFTELSYTEIACPDLRGDVEELYLLAINHAARYTFLDGLLRIQVAPDAPTPATTLELERVR